jgi:hypothetical protein
MGPPLFQWFDLEDFLASDSERPVCQQFVAMQFDASLHQWLLAAWQFPVEYVT